MKAKLDDSVLGNSNWSDEDQKNFWAILKRKRLKLDVVRIKVIHFTRSGEPLKLQAAIDLMQHFIKEFFNAPEQVLNSNKYPALYIDNLIGFIESMMNCALLMGDTAKAEEYCLLGEKLWKYRSPDQAMRTELQRIQREKYAAYLLIANHFIKQGDRKLACVWLDRHFNCKPLTAFNHNAYDIYVKYAYLMDDFSLAEKVRLTSTEMHHSFKDYLSETKRIYKDIVSHEEENDISRIAENFYTGFHAACRTLHIRGKKALAELDAVLRNPVEINGERYDLESANWNFLHEYEMPELGAYLGEVLCKEYKGKWKQSDHLLRSVVIIKGAEINPFDYAWRVVFEGYRLINEVIKDVERRIAV